MQLSTIPSHPQQILSTETIEVAKNTENGRYLNQVIERVSSEEKELVSQLEIEAIWSDDKQTPAFLAQALSHKSAEDVQTLILRVTEITNSLASRDTPPSTYERVFLRHLKQYLLSAPKAVADTRKATLKIVR